MRPCCIPPMWQSGFRPGTTRAAACCRTCWSRWASQHHSSARNGVSISHLPRTQPCTHTFAHMLVKMVFPAPQTCQEWSDFLTLATYSSAHMLVKMGFPAPQFRQKWSECLTPASFSVAHMQMPPIGRVCCICSGHCLCLWCQQTTSVWRSLTFTLTEMIDVRLSG